MELIYKNVDVSLEQAEDDDIKIVLSAKEASILFAIAASPVRVSRALGSSSNVDIFITYNKTKIHNFLTDLFSTLAALKLDDREAR